MVVNIYRNVFIFWSILLLIASSNIDAQIFPKEGSKLNYRIIGFSFPATSNKNTVQIALGNYTDEEAFSRQIIKSYTTDKNKVIGEVPAFGRDYTWRTITTVNSNSTKSELHHFGTLTVPDVDTSVTRLKILHSAKKYKDAYVFLDGTKTLYDMSGNPVWFFPGTKYSLQDIKVTTEGTITALAPSNPIEVNYNGDTLWKAPDSASVSGEKTEYFSHEFTRISNGHYMVIGAENVWWKLDTKDTNQFYDPSGKINEQYKRDGTNFFQKIECATLIEFDAKSNIVWYWKSSGYFRKSDLYEHKNDKGLYNLIASGNSFYFDEKNHSIYLSIRSVSRIIKFRYPDGTILATYGKKYTSEFKEPDDEMFCGQHSCKITFNGNMYLYDNNVCVQGGMPKIIIMKEPRSANDNLTKVWEYTCTIDPETSKTKSVFGFNKGGNVIELPDGSMFVCMSSRYNKVFIVNKNKEILWSAISEHRNPVSLKWEGITSYRASIILSQAELERLIWNSLK